VSYTTTKKWTYLTGIGGRERDRSYSSLTPELKLGPRRHKTVPDEDEAIGLTRQGIVERAVGNGDKLRVGAGPRHGGHSAVTVSEAQVQCMLIDTGLTKRQKGHTEDVYEYIVK